jgi:hypothetical protein
VGLCTPEVLEIINSVFKGRYIGADTPNADLKRLYSAVEERVVAKAGVFSEAFRASPLVRWPLYHLVAQRW